MSRRKSIALTRQLDELLSGVLPLDDGSNEALALLPVVASIGLDQYVSMPAFSLEAGHNQLLAAIANLPRQRPPLALPAWMRTPALAGGLAAALSGGAIAYAAQEATPDSPLYPVHQAVQAVSQNLPLLQQPTPAAVPTATAVPTAVPVGATSNIPATARSEGKAVQPATAKQSAEPARVADDRESDHGQSLAAGSRRHDDQAIQPTPTASALPGSRSDHPDRQDEVRPFASQSDRGVKGDFRALNDGGNSGATGNGNAADNENGRAGDRPTRSGRGN